MDEIDRLLAAARTGSADAFNQLVAGQAALAYQVAEQHTGRPARAVADRDRAFQAAWAAIGRYDGDAAGWPAWLLGFVVAAEQDRDGTADMPPPPPARWPAAGESPADYGKSDDLDALLRWALSRLPAEARWLLVLDGAGLSYQDIGAVVRMDLATVKLRLARARADLATALTATGRPQAAPTSADGAPPDRPASPRTRPGPPAAGSS